MSAFANRSYVSQPGDDIWEAQAHGVSGTTDLIMVRPDGSSSIAAGDMMSPNGMAISPDGKRLFVAECMAMRITCFDIDPLTGKLSNRRPLGIFDGGIPDGICLGRESAVWSAVPVAVRGTAVSPGPGVVR